MNRITAGQLCAMGLIGEAAVLFCMSGEVGWKTAAGFAAAALILFAAALPLAVYYDRGGRLSRAAGGVLLVWTVYWGGRLFSMQQRASEVIYIPWENSGGIAGKLLISGLIGAVCLYISSTGAKALGRASVIAAALGLVCLAASAVSAAKTHQWERLMRSGSGLSLTGEVIRGLKAGGGIGAFAVLLSIQSGKKVRSSAVFFASKALLSIVVILTAVLVSGGIMSTVQLPVVTAAQLSQPFPSQRIDSLFLIVFTVYIVFSIAVQTAAAAYLIRRIFPRFSHFTSLTALALMTAAAMI